MPEPDLLAIVARSLESGLQDLTGRIVNFCTWLKESGPGKIYKAALSQGNLGQICSLLYPAVGLELVNKMVAFNCRVEREVVVGGEWGQGVHKLRDLLRWCKALVEGGGGLQPAPAGLMSLLLPLRHLAASCQLLQASCPSSLLARAGNTSTEAGLE